MYHYCNKIPKITIIEEGQNYFKKYCKTSTNFYIFVFVSSCVFPKSLRLPSGLTNSAYISINFIYIQVYNVVIVHM